MIIALNSLKGSALFGKAINEASGYSMLLLDLKAKFYRLLKNNFIFI